VGGAPRRPGDVSRWPRAFHDIVSVRDHGAAAWSILAGGTPVDEIQAQLNALNVQIQTLMDRL